MKINYSKEDNGKSVNVPAKIKNLLRKNIGKQVVALGMTMTVLMGSGMSSYACKMPDTSMNDEQKEVATMGYIYALTGNASEVGFLDQESFEKGIKLAEEYYGGQFELGNQGKFSNDIFIDDYRSVHEDIFGDRGQEDNKMLDYLNPSHERLAAVSGYYFAETGIDLGYRNNKTNSFQYGYHNGTEIKDEKLFPDSLGQIYQKLFDEEVPQDKAYDLLPEYMQDDNGNYYVANADMSNLPEKLEEYTIPQLVAANGFESFNKGKSGDFENVELTEYDRELQKRGLAEIYGTSADYKRGVKSVTKDKEVNDFTQSLKSNTYSVNEELEDSNYNNMSDKDNVQIIEER